MLKRILKTALRNADAELLRYYPLEKELIEAHPDMSLRDVLRVQALSTGSQISLSEARFMGELVRRSDPTRPIIEIGTLFGYSTRVIAANKAPGQRLITVDNYSWNPLGLSSAAHKLATRLALAEAIEEHDTTVLAMGAAEFYRGYAGAAPALFFCDADHSYEAVLADLRWALGVGATIICGDDYEPPHDGVMRAVDELGGPSEKRGGLFVLRRDAAS